MLENLLHRFLGLGSCKTSVASPKLPPSPSTIIALMFRVDTQDMQEENMVSSSLEEESALRPADRPVTNCPSRTPELLVK